MYLRIPKLMLYVDIEAPAVICLSKDKLIAVEATGRMNRLKLLGIEIFSHHRRFMTGNIYKLVGPLKYSSNPHDIENSKSNPDNIVAYDQETLDPYEYELYMTVPPELLDKEWKGEKKYTYEYA